MGGFCGSDLNSFRGLNSLVSYPRTLGHGVAGTILQNSSDNRKLSVGTDVALSPYTNCREYASCRHGRSNACQFNQTLGVQRDVALTELLVMPPEKLYPAKLISKELCLVDTAYSGIPCSRAGENYHQGHYR